MHKTSMGRPLASDRYGKWHSTVAGEKLVFKFRFAGLFVGQALRIFL